PLAALLAAAGCAASPPAATVGGSRPVMVQVPAGYDGSHPLPLIVLIHAYGIDGAIQEAYFQLGQLVDGEGVLMVAPNGNVNGLGQRYWNATPACCDVGQSGVDDLGYLRGVIAEVRAKYSVDPKRIFAVGHSNGAFMAHRLACDDAAEIAAI